MRLQITYRIWQIKYNTIYVPRTFHTSLGTDVTVSDNEYGYRIDQDAELTQLLEDLKKW